MFTYSFELGTFSSEKIDLAKHFGHKAPSGMTWEEFCLVKGWTADDIKRDIENAEWHERRLERRANERKLERV